MILRGRSAEDFRDRAKIAARPHTAELDFSVAVDNPRLRALGPEEQGIGGHRDSGVAAGTGEHHQQWERPDLVFRELPHGLPSVSTVLVWRHDDDSPILPRFRERPPVPGAASGGGVGRKESG